MQFIWEVIPGHTSRAWGSETMGREGKVASAWCVISQLPLGATGLSLPGTPGTECRRHLVVLPPIGEGAGYVYISFPHSLRGLLPGAAVPWHIQSAPLTGRAASMTRNDLQVKKCGCWQLEVGSLCINALRRREVSGALAAVFKHPLLPFQLRDFSVIKQVGKLILTQEDRIMALCTSSVCMGFPCQAKALRFT